MSDPPVALGASQDTTDELFAFEEAVTEIGAPGVVEGTAAGDELDHDPGPEAFVAFTVKL
jgi:hypothetical protein